jgi:hypothetical protein
MRSSFLAQSICHSNGSQSLHGCALGVRQAFAFLSLGRIGRDEHGAAERPIRETVP